MRPGDTLGGMRSTTALLLTLSTATLSACCASAPAPEVEGVTALPEIRYFMIADA